MNSKGNGRMQTRMACRISLGWWVASTLLLSAGCLPRTVVPRPNLEHESGLQLFIHQKGAAVRVGNGQTVMLQKGGFAFSFVSDTLVAFKVNIAAQPDAYNLFLAGKDVEIIPGLCGGCSFAAALGDPPRDALISNTGSNYWFHASASQTRMHEYRFTKGLHIQKRLVDTLRLDPDYVPPGPLDTLYLCVVSSQFDTSAYRQRVLQRLGFRIVYGDTLRVDGVVLPRTLEQSAVFEPQAERSVGVPHADSARTFILRINGAPPTRECFRLSALGAQQETLYVRTVCTDEAMSSAEGTELHFHDLVRHGLYTLEVLFPEGNAYSLFEARPVESLFGEEAKGTP